MSVLLNRFSRKIFYEPVNFQSLIHIYNNPQHNNGKKLTRYIFRKTKYVINLQCRLKREFNALSEIIGQP